MGRLIAMFTGLVGVLMVPLAMSAPTAWLLLTPAYSVFVSLACTGAMIDGYDGRPEHARRWGFVALVVTALVCGALELGAEIRGGGQAYWGGPWLCALSMGWMPPVVAGIMGGIGTLRRRQLHVRAVRQRRASAEQG